MPIPGLSDQVELKPMFRKKLKWKSYTTLILLLVLGAGTIIASYFVSTYALEKRIGELETSREKLLIEIGNQSSHLERLEMPPEPNPASLQKYIHKIPAARELPRFLLQLDQWAQKTGIRIHYIGIDDEPGLKLDSLRDYLAKLDELARNVGNKQDANAGNNQNAENNQNGENNQNAGNILNIGKGNQDGHSNQTNASPTLPSEEAARLEQLFLSNPRQFAKEFPLKKEQNMPEDQSESGKPAERTQQGTEAYQALQSYIPFGMIGLSIESESNLQQVMQFLRELRKGPRLVYIEEWSYAHDPKKPARTIFRIKLHIFYYKDDSGFIPQLPPLQFTGAPAQESNQP